MLFVEWITMYIYNFNSLNFWLDFIMCSFCFRDFDNVVDYQKHVNNHNRTKLYVRECCDTVHENIIKTKSKHACSVKNIQEIIKLHENFINFISMNQKVLSDNSAAFHQNFHQWIRETRNFERFLTARDEIFSFFNCAFCCHIWIN